MSSIPPAETAVSISTPGTINIDAEIARAQALLAELAKKKEELATQSLRQREQALDQAMKTLNVNGEAFIRLIKHLDEARELIGADSEGQLITAINLIADTRQKLEVPRNQDLTIMLRNRSISSSKAKRLPDSTLKTMHALLKEGAKVPEVAKYFKVSIATVNARKAAWRLTKRKGVPVISLNEAMKRLDGSKRSK